MEESRMKNAMRFYLLATQLKYKIRKGWDEQHWNVKKNALRVLPSIFMAPVF